MRVAALKPATLAFDYHEIIRQAIARVVERIDSTRIARSLVPRTFTIPELCRRARAPRWQGAGPGQLPLRKFERMLEDGIIQQAPGKRITASKPAAVYRFTGGPRGT